MCSVGDSFGVELEGGMERNRMNIYAITAARNSKV